METQTRPLARRLPFAGLALTLLLALAGCATPTTELAMGEGIRIKDLPRFDKIDKQGDFLGLRNNQGDKLALSENDGQELERLLGERVVATDFFDVVYSPEEHQDSKWLQKANQFGRGLNGDEFERKRRWAGDTAVVYLWTNTTSEIVCFVASKKTGYFLNISAEGLNEDVFRKIVERENHE